MKYGHSPRTTVSTAAPLAALLLALPPGTASALDKLVWANAGSDMLAAENWTNGIAPSATSVLVFDTPAVVQPVLTGDLTVTGVSFAPGVESGKAVPAASLSDGFDGYNCSGYTITGVGGAALTVDGNSYNNGWTRSFNHSSLGKNVIDVPVVFTDREHPIAVFGGELEFRRPLVASPKASVTVTGGQYGELALLDANPEFRPAKFALDGGAAVALGHPEALLGVGAIATRSVYQNATQNGLPNYAGVRFLNRSGETARFSASAFTVKQTADVVLSGGPFDLSETVWEDDLQDSKPHHFETSVTVKDLSYAGGATGTRDFVVVGEGTLHNRGTFFADSPLELRLRIQGGCYVGEGNPGRPGAAVAVDLSDKSLGPSIYGLAEDFVQEEPAGAAREAGAFYFSNANNNRGGFAAFGADRRVRLSGGGVLECGSVNPSFSALLFPYRLAFGAADADAAAVLENDIDLAAASATADRGVFVRDGPAAVEARLAGTVTSTKALKVPFVKLGPGVLALDGPVLVTGAGRVEEGGLLANAAAAGSFAVSEGAWLGGTGSVAGGATVAAGGSLRGGEGGSGTLSLGGETTLADGARIDVALAPGGSAGAVALAAGASWTQRGTVAVRLLADDIDADSLPASGAATVLDWTDSPGAAVPGAEAFVPDFDAETFSRVRLAVSGTRLRLFWRLAGNRATLITVR